MKMFCLFWVVWSRDHYLKCRWNHWACSGQNLDSVTFSPQQWFMRQDVQISLLTSSPHFNLFYSSHSCLYWEVSERASVCVPECMGMRAQKCGCPQRLEEGWIYRQVMSLPHICILRTELWSFGIAASPLNWWAISPTPIVNISFCNRNFQNDFFLLCESVVPSFLVFWVASWVENNSWGQLWFIL